MTNPDHRSRWEQVSNLSSVDPGSSASAVTVCMENKQKGNSYFTQIENAMIYTQSYVI